MSQQPVLTEGNKADLLAGGIYKMQVKSVTSKYFALNY